jgi:molecular chaperone HtpG
VLKEGLATGSAPEHRERLGALLRFESSRGQGRIGLGEYVEKMPEGQDAIYYLIGESVEQLRRSPYLEAFRARGRDVLLLTDPIDEFAIPGLDAYKGKRLQAADRADTSAGETVPADVREKFAGVIAFMKGKLAEVADVRLSTRLTDSAACLVADDTATSAHLERIMERMGRGKEASKRVLELNPANPAVQALRDLHAADAADARLDGYARLLYEEAVIAEGSTVADPVSFARLVNNLIARDAAAKIGQ